jgi:hypothetical protein
MRQKGIIDVFVGRVNLCAAMNKQLEQLRQDREQQKLRPLYCFRNWKFILMAHTTDTAAQRLATFEHQQGRNKEAIFTVLDPIEGFALSQKYRQKSYWCSEGAVLMSGASSNRYADLMQQVREMAMEEHMELE